jgi:anti-anti-sigma regulatory factor
MLKITLHDSAAELRFNLEGRLTGAWVKELRQCWQTASSTTHGRKTVLDLREVDFVDADGGSLLAEMHGAGVQIQALTPLIQAVVEEVCQGRQCGTVEGKPGSSDALLRADTSGPDLQSHYKTKSRAS